jgi:chromosome segregation ATPase
MVPAAVAILLASVCVVEAVALLWLVLSLLYWKVKAESAQARINLLERQTKMLDEMSEVLRTKGTSFKQLRDLNKRLETDLLSLRIENQSLQDKIKYLDSLIEQIQAERDKFRSDCDSQHAAMLKMVDNHEWQTGEVVRLTKLNDDNVETIARLSVEKNTAEANARQFAADVETVKKMNIEEQKRTARAEADCKAAERAAVKIQSDYTDTNNEYKICQAQLKDAVATIDRLNKLIAAHGEKSTGPSNAQITEALQRARAQFRDGVDALVMREAFIALHNGLDATMKKLQSQLFSGIDRIGGELRNDLFNPESVDEGDDLDEPDDEGTDMEDEDEDIDDGSDLDDEDDSWVDSDLEDEDEDDGFDGEE